MVADPDRTSRETKGPFLREIVMKTIVFAMLAVAGLAAAANAQVFNAVLVDGDARFTLGTNASAIGNGADTTFSVNGIAGPSHLSSAWWWVRVDGTDLRESAVYQPSGVTVTQASANQIRIVYNYANRFDLVVQFAVSGFEFGYGSLTQTVSIRNRSGSAKTFNLFNYNNVNVLGTPNDDSAQATGPQTIEFTDGAFPNTTATYEATNAIRVEGTSLVRDLLTNASIDDLSGGVVNAGPGDLEVGSQFSFTLGNNGVQSVSTTLTIIPTPGAVALMALGGLFAARRRRA